MTRILLALTATFGLGAAASAQPKAGSDTMVVMETSHGTIKIELFADKAPVSVKNFLSYVDDKHYDGTVFHRVIKDFMVQGGGFDADMKQKKTKPPIANESSNGLKNTRGTLPMARTSDPDSATSQFFINTVDNAFLDKAQSRDGVGYCVFGRVTEGMDVVDKIRAVATGVDRKSGMSDVPTVAVTINKVTRAAK
jgi:peptidyl-prolyl cis-trans isomerase B (cyclophilin B)